ncbi:hypothetical protein BJ742DRAFT_280262 [Cladochytrium replicatum]|nr:hypothetical protein BJ742DRAFT_280262 [Cladochytrium replicatum]
MSTILLLRRRLMLETLVSRLRDNLTLQNKRSLFNSLPNTFLGFEMVEWMMANCNLLIREEAIRLASSLLDEGYIVSADLETTFREQDYFIFQVLYLVGAFEHLLIFAIWQSSYFWPSKSRIPTDFDYAVYLLKRENRVSAKYLLTEWEEERLVRLRRSLHHNWRQVEETAYAQNAKHGALTKGDRMILRLQEYWFWYIHRPPAGCTPLHQLLSESKKMEKEKPKRIERDREDLLTPIELAANLEAKADDLHATLGRKLMKVSQASRSLLQRCELMRPLDPILNQGEMWNPWLQDEENAPPRPPKSSRSLPTVNEIRLWLYSLADLLNDPLGVSTFAKFLKQEFSSENLEFYLAVEALGRKKTEDDDFNERARRVMQEFIPIGSRRELNIDSGLRASIVQKFSDLGVPNTPLSKDDSSSLFEIRTPSREPSFDLQTPPLQSLHLSYASDSVGTYGSPDIGGSVVSFTPSRHFAHGSISLSSVTSGNATQGSRSNSSVVSSDRSTVISSSSYLRPKRKYKIPLDVFREVQDAVFAMMAKDSYPRFCGSDVLKDVLRRRLEEDAALMEKEATKDVLQSSRLV